jgi:hypothetical protein
MSSDTRFQEKKRREETIDTKELSRESITFANLKLIVKKYGQQFDQVMKQMIEMIMKMRNMNSRIATLENSSSSFITVASITNASTSHQSALHIVTASVTAPTSTLAMNNQLR